ncbi:alpha/beta hydrolase fold family protein [Elsinoe ampelina]|uniref:Alpha/beta hydrolase fold family protein n=1 Tax=Elsinoe ampelina TaxID=302913 RepID=A0A6A6GQZ8_9PEZI|nr:alpha/beta hydrolase fold family protein [Elsinoe ampelina]
MPNTKTVHVPHLGGIDAAYQMPHPYDPSKPTLVMVNSFTTSSELYKRQFKNEKLTSKMNLIAIELLGHGQTRTKSLHFTYWDTAIMNLQVIDALDIKGKIFVLGTSQGGWITVRMALLAPEKITGILPLGTSMDYESPRSLRLGCWDGVAATTPSIKHWTEHSPPDFTPGPDFANFLIDQGFGEDVAQEEREFWVREIEENYRGDDGRQRARLAAINLRERDGLHGRLWDVKCPVLWMHGTKDVVYTVANAEEEIKLFVNSKEAKLKVIEGGRHFLSASHPEEVEGAVLEFVERWT